MKPLAQAIALICAAPLVYAAPTPQPEPAPAPAARSAAAAADSSEGEAGETRRSQGSTDRTLKGVDVTGFQGERAASLKYSRPLQDTPRIITVLPSALLEEQGVATLREALRNIPGISLQAGEGNPPGGDQLKIRGFNARDDLNVNGTRDLGNYFRDPFYVDQIEVVKGPNSAYSGRGSAGGTINFVTKAPQTEAFSRLEVSLGSDAYKRTTLDVNTPLDDNSGLRVNVMAHDADLAGRDIAEEQRWGLYAAYVWGLTGDTRISADLFYTRQDDLPDAGLPADRDPSGAHARGTGEIPPGLDFDAFYGHVDDYKHVDVMQLGLTLEHTLGNGMLLRNQTRLSEVDNDSITSSPRIRNIPAGSSGFAGAQVRGDTKPRDQTDEGLSNQTALLATFNTGAITHDWVAGIEYGQYTYENQRRPDVSGALTDLYLPQPRPRPATPYDGTVYGFETDELAFYMLDTLALSPRWEVNLGARWDHVEATAYEFGRPDNRRLERTDAEWSGSAGLVYKLSPRTSLYAAVGTAFEVSGNFDRNQVQLAGGATARVADAATFNIAPEQTTAYELGAKWKLGENLDVNAAVFETRKDDARFPGQAGGDNSVLDATLRVRGFELLSAGRLTPEWRLYAGYAYLDSEVRDAPSRPFAIGQELGGTPEHSLSVFTTYDFTPKLSLGGGLQHVGEHFSGVQATATGTRKVRIPQYTVGDFYATWRFSDAVQVRMNVYNLTDRDYLSQVAEGGGQGIPGRGRQYIATLRWDF